MQVNIDKLRRQIADLDAYGAIQHGNGAYLPSSETLARDLLVVLDAIHAFSAAPDLKPCPFCGGEATRQVNKLPNGGETYETGCNNVGCMVLPFALQLSPDYADRNWNTRTDIAAAIRNRGKS